MNGGVPDGPSVLASLAAAADAARQAYMTALQANPGADLSRLYVSEMAAQTAWSSATAKTLGPNSAIQIEQTALDSATSAIRRDLKTVQDIAEWAARVDNLVRLATKLAAHFA